MLMNRIKNPEATQRHHEKKTGNECQHFSSNETHIHRYLRQKIQCSTTFHYELNNLVGGRKEHHELKMLN